MKEDYHPHDEVVEGDWGRCGKYCACKKLFHYEIIFLTKFKTETCNKPFLAFQRLYPIHYKKKNNICQFYTVVCMNDGVISVYSSCRSH